MGNDLKSACDGILQKVVTGKDRVPGVVAMITDRSANIYEGAAGERILGAGQAMTTDTVFAIFSTTKAITGTAVLQCVEEGKLDRDDNPLKHAPHTATQVAGSEWTHAYPRELAAFPLPGLKLQKYWPPVARAEARHHHTHADAAHGRPRL